jgi:indolepyruvate ferredoxin oxidoreductase beta subunit
MVYNILLTGVGGEGILMTSTILTRAASIEGHAVRGTQFHGLAQRGGSIPTTIRFGRNVYSPTIPRGQADLIFGLEPIEAARFCFYASKERTSFVIDTYPLKPVYANLLNQPYPTMKQIESMIKPFAKKTILVDASNICHEKLGNPVYGNVMAIGVAVSAGLLSLKPSSIIESLKISVPRGIEQNVKAFRMGMEYK